MCSVASFLHVRSTLKFGVQRVFFEVKWWPIICGDRNKFPRWTVYLPSSRVEPEFKLGQFYSPIFKSRQAGNQKTQEAFSELHIVFGFRYTLANIFLCRFSFSINFFFFFACFSSPLKFKWLNFSILRQVPSHVKPITSTLWDWILLSLSTASCP